MCKAVCCCICMALGGCGMCKAVTLYETVLVFGCDRLCLFVLIQVHACDYNY